MSTQAFVNGPVIYDPDEAAAVLRCKPSWLKEKARRREIPFTMIGGSYRWTADHLAEIVRLGEQEPSPPARAAPRHSAATADDVSRPLRARPPQRARTPSADPGSTYAALPQEPHGAAWRGPDRDSTAVG